MLIFAQNSITMQSFARKAQKLDGPQHPKNKITAKATVHR